MLAYRRARRGLHRPELALPLPGRVFAQPSVDVQFPEAGIQRFQAGFDVSIEVPVGPVAPSVGVGIAAVSQSPDERGRGEGDVAGVAFAGASIGWRNRVRPFAQVRYTAADLIENSAVAWTGGVAIGL